MSRVTSLESELTQMCFEADRLAGKAYREGNMELYYRLQGEYEAYKSAAQLTEKYFSNPLNDY